MLAFGLLVAWALTTFQVTSAQDLTHGHFDRPQRIACQTIIEDLRWSHRIWPEANPAPKPERREVLRDARIAAQVDDSLRQEAALQEGYGVTITDAMLQAELARMARSTKAPERLQELFDALGNDPRTIAECLARPALVERRLYNSYVWDNRRHGALRARAEAALAAYGGDPDLLEASGAERHRVVLERKDETAQPEPAAPSGGKDGLRPIVLEGEAFEREVARYTGYPDEPLDGPAPALRETETAFVYTEVLSQSEDRLVLEQTVWPKQGFDVWWRARARGAGEAVPERSSGALTLPAVTGSAGSGALAPRAAVAADTWLPTGTSGRFHHTAVWTGSEMIVWGGYGGGADLNTGGLYYPYGTHAQLSVNVTGQGNVTSGPAGIDCPGTCAADFPLNDWVDLTAILDPSWTSGSWIWSGACTGDGACSVLMDQDQVADISFHCELISLPATGPITTPVPAWECANLEAVNGFSIAAGGEVTFQAQNSIHLGPGFQVSSGGVFHAVIAP